MIDCVLIVVSYQSSHDVTTLLSSVPAAVGNLSWHAVIVNNDPRDSLTPVVAAHEHVDLIDTESNIGYAGAINVALAAAPPSRWTLFLNPDVRLGVEAIRRMTHASGMLRAVVPLITDFDGVLQHSLRREPTILGSLGDAIFGNHWPSRPGFLSETVRAPGPYREAHAVDWATGAALLVPSRVAHEVGSWDAARFFLYSEETDYCRRLRALGSTIQFVPEAVVSHRGGGSGSSDQLHALREVNRTRYFAKWHHPLAAGGFTAIVMLHHILRVRRPESRATLRALTSPAARAHLPGGSR